MSAPSTIIYTPLRIPGFQTGDKFACILKHVFSEQECAELICRSEAQGYIPAKEGDQSGRSNYRCIIDDEQVAAQLFERIAPWLPKTRVHEDPYAASAHAKKVTDTLLGVNPRLRFQRYEPGQEFARHVDGAYEREDGTARTHVTLQLYLNQGFTGGATSFLDVKHYQKDTAEAPLDVIPEMGMVLLFEHELLHSGARLEQGRKYTLRTDILYNVVAPVPPKE
jgi:predicted 2-oxoglutarate/Fe(II)-dependent dioxygenase YbiX